MSHLADGLCAGEAAQALPRGVDVGDAEGRARLGHHAGLGRRLQRRVQRARNRREDLLTEKPEEKIARDGKVRKEVVRGEERRWIYEERGSPVRVGEHGQGRGDEVSLGVREGPVLQAEFRRGRQDVKHRRVRALKVGGTWRRE